jgi:hypothetical protein
LTKKLRGNRGSLRLHWGNLRKPTKIEVEYKIEEVVEIEVEYKIVEEVFGHF